MANSDIVRGLTPLRYLNGSPWNGKVRRYLIPSSDGTAVFKGDLVKLAGDGGAIGAVVTGIPVGGMATIAQSAAGDTSVGVVVDFEPDTANLNLLYRVASTARVALVADDENVIFEIQEVSAGTAFTSAEIGLNANVVVAAGSTTTGLSGMELNNAGEATTSTLNCKIMGLVMRENNEYGENAKWEVLINNHAYRAGITGV